MNKTHRFSRTCFAGGEFIIEELFNYSRLSMSTVTIIRDGEACEVRCINAAKVRRLARNLPDSDALKQLSDVFQILSDPNRLKVLHCLFQEEVCVCDLSATLGMSMSAVSHQLRLLRALRLVKSRKEGRIVHYSLADEHVAKLMEMGLKHERE
jgi:DNA-binding transcriptional ArsR family regulator